MVRRTLTREITTTKIKAARMEVVDGMPQAVPVEDEIILGSFNLEKAQKHVNKKYGEGVTVFDVEKETKRYSMPIDEFIELATVIEDEESATDEN